MSFCGCECESPCCCPMMAPSATTGVVDANLDVFGVRNLSVADLSVIPEINTGHTAWPAFLVGLDRAVTRCGDNRI